MQGMPSTASRTLRAAGVPLAAQRRGSEELRATAGSLPGLVQSPLPHGHCSLTQGAEVTSRQAVLHLLSRRLWGWLQAPRLPVRQTPVAPSQ